MGKPGKQDMNTERGPGGLPPRCPLRPPLCLSSKRVLDKQTQSRQCGAIKPEPTLKLTNIDGLPAAIISAIQNDPYDRGDSDYTVTELVNPVRITLLRQRHKDEIVVDARERLWSLLGQAMHHILQRASQDQTFTEERFFTTVHGKKISGAIDLYHASGLLEDFKVPSGWVMVYKSRLTEWEAQTNLLAYLMRLNDFAVTSMEIVCLFRDWTAYQALRSPAYPQAPMMVYPVESWSNEKAAQRLAGSVFSLIDSLGKEDDDLPPCSIQDRWEQPTIWAVMKTGRKSALRLLPTEDEAVAWIDTNGGTHIEKRPGARKRCEGGPGGFGKCEVRDWCSQWKAYSAAKEAAGGSTE